MRLSVILYEHALTKLFHSRQHIPEVFHPLMLESDSPIIDFYTSSFEIDMNGKKMSWQGVVLLPFIDQKRLLDAMKPGYSKLTEHEIHRNKWGKSLLFISDENSLYPSVEALYGKRRNQEVCTELRRDSNKFDRLSARFNRC